MQQPDAASGLALIASRLNTLSALLDKAEGLWVGRDLDTLAAARLAIDMHPLSWQVAATATQAEQFLAWSRGKEQPNTVTPPTGWHDAKALLREVLAKVQAAAAEAAALPETKHIRLEPIGMCLDLSGQRYLDDWILPNLYFHLITAYAILRMQGLEFGKADFMAHLAGDIRPIAPTPV
ncbi:hypothetical protein EDF56_1011129 [Novosphingobium sp. PhB165]|uniref:DUF1993 family protein n=1 Tax=Novosphingobium sp. PhB165 TaxID=2485105 RepID=UPI00104A13E5|nr:DUF1993 family protein [Novosphingobium sp. PhB165]TCM22439.1 hypothetical protein EDF56_1011129 [Novosphingobium sp. PhB165]